MAKVLVTGSGVYTVVGGVGVECTQGEEYDLPECVAQNLIKGGRGELVLNEKPKRTRKPKAQQDAE